MKWIKGFVRKEMKDMDYARQQWKDKQAEITALEKKLSADINDFVIRMAERLNQLKKEQEDLLI